MADISNAELIRKAGSVVKPRKIGEYMVGDVGCALVTVTGNVFLGVCIDTGSGMGFCAEHSAIAAMVTAGEYKISKIVAVWQYEGDTYILPPCGRCREFIHQIDKENLETKVILASDESMKLSDLLPSHDRFTKVQEFP